MTKEIFRNACPRNCFGTCSILSVVENGGLTKVTGDKKHGFSKGSLCAKGYAYTQYVYDPQRLKYPLIQRPRNSGNWERISWEEALTVIAKKIVSLNKRYDSNLSIGYNKFSGNLGILHYAVEGFFNSIGPHTKPVGNPCLTTGANAIHYTVGEMSSPNPEKMAKAMLIVIWGANPAVTNIQQMKFIYEARDNGATIVVIDPVFTETARMADVYIQIKPGTDGLLALTVSKLLVEHEEHDRDFVLDHSIGWEPFKAYLEEEISMEDTIYQTGVPLEAIQKLTALYAQKKPCATWAGFGLQRHPNGGQIIRAINALVATSGNHSIENGGLYYAHSHVEDFPLHLLNHEGPEHPKVKQSREIDINFYPNEALQLTDPPLKFLWIASRNPLTQDQNLKGWDDLFQQQEMVVTVDLFMTRTAARSDIVLPAATHFEAMDLNVSYWHYWLSINQQAIEPYFEAKSDLEISRLLAKKLNEIQPGFSNFPYEKTDIDWIKEEITDDVKEKYSFTDWRDLLKRPYQAKEQKPFTGKFQFFSTEAKENNFPAIPRHQEISRDGTYAFNLFSPQSLLKIHSQFETNPWLTAATDNVATVELNDTVAASKQITDGMNVIVYNDVGMLKAVAKINPYLPKNILLMEQAGDQPINKLINQTMDIMSDEEDRWLHSTHFYNIFVNIKKS